MALFAMVDGFEREMGTQTVYPNNQVLISSAYTPATIGAVLQPLTCGMIGLNASDPAASSTVRQEWPTSGQPFQDVGTDICYLACVPADEEYSRVRDLLKSQATVNDKPVLTQTWRYTKGWQITWTFYGPNAEDRARMVRSAMFQDYFNDQLNLANLFPVNDPPEVTRTPELINAEWFERADFHIMMYEQVTETIQPGIATSVEVKVYDGSPNDPVADFVVDE
jgi:hypothetical protein